LTAKVKPQGLVCNPQSRDFTICQHGPKTAAKAIIKPTMRQSNRSFTLLQAAADSPVLARLSALAQDSSDRLKAIRVLVPETLWPAIQPGPIDGASWCLLVNSNAASAKLRQLTPALLAHLRTKGWDVTALRIKVQMRASPLHAQ